MKIYLDAEETRYITKKELNAVTKTRLEKNVIGETVGCDTISKIDGHEFLWNYRRNEGFYKPICKKEEATFISVCSREGIWLKDIYL